MKKRSDFFLGFCMQPAAQATDIFVRGPADGYRACEEQAQYGQEAFTVLCLNARNRLIAGGIISIGIMESTLVHPREVFRKAIEVGACSIILIHNHPSGDPSPSAEDVRMTNQILKAGKIIGIKVQDHIIIAPKSDRNTSGYLSMKESGLLNEEDQ